MEIEGWHDFLVAVVGAAAALAGLLVVAISINLKEILRSPSLPGRAGQTVAILAGPLVACAVVLIPDQPVRLVGGELLVVGLGIWALITMVAWHQRDRHRPVAADGSGAAGPAPRSSRASQLVLPQLATLPTVAAGIVLLAGSTAGLYVLAFGVLATFAVALLNAWILLVEVLR